MAKYFYYNVIQAIQSSLSELYCLERYFSENLVYAIDPPKGRLFSEEIPYRIFQSLARWSYAATYIFQQKSQCSLTSTRYVDIFSRQAQDTLELLHLSTLYLGISQHSVFLSKLNFALTNILTGLETPYSRSPIRIHQNSSIHSYRHTCINLFSSEIKLKRG